MFGWFKKEEPRELPSSYTDLRTEIKVALLALSDKNENKARLLEKLKTKYPANLKSNNISIQIEELKTLLNRVRKMK